MSGNLQKYQTKNPLRRKLIGAFQDALIDLVALTEPSSILDAGCGEGFNLGRLHERLDCALHGIDIREEAVSMAQELAPRADVQLGSVFELPFADKSIDTVMCNEVLEHLDSPGEALAEVCRVARRRVVLSVPHEPFFMLGNLIALKNVSRFGNDPEHLNHWNPSRFAAFAGEYCDVQRIERPFPWILVEARPRSAAESGG